MDSIKLYLGKDNGRYGQNTLYNNQEYRIIYSVDLISLEEKLGFSKGPIRFFLSSTLRENEPMSYSDKISSFVTQ